MLPSAAPEKKYIYLFFYHLPDELLILLARRGILLAPGKRAISIVDPFIYKHQVWKLNSCPPATVADGLENLPATLFFTLSCFKWQCVTASEK